MNLIIVVISLIVSVESSVLKTLDNSAENDILRPRILGGVLTSIEQVPYQAAILLTDRILCGAAIISEYWLVTAGHCTYQRDVNKMTIRTGVSNWNDKNGKDYELEKTYLHPDYEYFMAFNDISLIKVKTRITFDQYRQPIKISSEPIPSTGSVLVSGYGRIKEKVIGPGQLRAAVLPIIDQDICSSRYKPIVISESMFCAALGGPDDTCRGDSGSPAVIHGLLVGIVSAGKGCGSSHYPGIYTRVPLYRDWIRNITGV